MVVGFTIYYNIIDFKKMETSMDKRILFIGTKFFSIEEQLIGKFEEYGFCVDFFDDRPSQNSWFKGISKLNAKVTRPFNKRYFNKIIESTRERKYDIIFVLNGKTVDATFLKKLKGIFTKAEFVFYTYDSIKIYPEIYNTLKFYNRRYTFDLLDSKEITELSFLPLFYNKKIVETADTYTDKNIDLLSVCTAHSNRYKVIKELFPVLKAEGVNVFSYLYLNKLQYLYNKIFDVNFKNSKKQEFEFIPLSEKENYKLLKSTSVVFDVEHSKQTGLTMRTIETLGFNKKLITTNKNIRNYNFYDSGNIFILENAYSISNLVKFIFSPSHDVPKEIYEQYEIDKFVRIILGYDDLGDYLC